MDGGVNSLMPAKPTPRDVYGPDTREFIFSELKSRGYRVVAFREPVIPDLYIPSNGLKLSLYTNYRLSINKAESNPERLNPMYPRLRLIVTPIQPQENN